MADARTQDPYRILGVPRNATRQEVHAAYKKKARELHPDVNPSPDAEERFREVAAAYAILKDDEQRRRYDRFSFGAHGTPPRQRARRQRYSPRDLGFDGVRFEDVNVDVDDLKNPFDFFMRRERRRANRPKQREVQLKIALAHAYNGTTLNMVLDLPTELGSVETRRIRLKIPKGAKEGDRLQLKDPECTVVLTFEPDPDFEIEGRDITTRVLVSPWEAALGREITIRTPGGPLKLKVPAGASSGQRLRIRGKGLPRKAGRDGAPGDLYVSLEITVPKSLTPEEQALFEQLADVSAFDPRKR